MIHHSHHPPVIPKKGEKTGHKKPKSKRPPTTVQFCDKGIKHHCFKPPGHGWFVMVNDRDRSKKNASFFCIHSVARVNSPAEVSKYIMVNLLEGENKNRTLERFMEMLDNGEIPENTHVTR